jgi:hypothetical protein
MTYADTCDFAGIVLFAAVDSYTALVLNSVHYRSVLHSLTKSLLLDIALANRRGASV